jgi:hypothetical protein
LEPDHAGRNQHFQFNYTYHILEIKTRN